MQLRSHPFSTWSVRWALVVAAAANTVACPGTLDPTGFFPECDPPVVLDRHCSGSICHSSPESSSNVVSPDLVSDGFAQRLIDAPADYEGVDDPDRCPEMPELLVDTQSPDQSLLIKKLHGMQSCGDRMPLTGSSLPPDELECLVGWVQELAAENASTGGPSAASGGATAGSGGAGTGGVMGAIGGGAGTAGGGNAP